MGSVLIYQYCSDPTLVHTLMWQLAAFEMKEPIRQELEDDQIRRKGMCGLYLQNEHQQQLRYCHTLQQGSAHVWGGASMDRRGRGQPPDTCHPHTTPHLSSHILLPSSSTHKPCPHLPPSPSTLTFHPPTHSHGLPSASSLIWVRVWSAPS